MNILKKIKFKPIGSDISVKRYEESICRDCATKEDHSWHVYIRYGGLPKKYKCEKCGNEYYENEDD